MGTDGACGLLFCAAKRSGVFPPNMPAGLRACVSRLIDQINLREMQRAVEVRELKFHTSRKGTEIS